MRGAALSRLLLAAALCGAASPAALAVADPSEPLQRTVDHAPEPSPDPYLAPMIELGVHDGHEIQAYGEAGKVYLAASTAHATTVYVVPGMVRPRRLVGDFGPYGSISMRFRPSRNRTWVKPHRSCRGKHRFANRIGRFTGQLRFRGEGGFVSVRARRAKGMVRTIARRCLRQLRKIPPLQLAATARAVRPGPDRVQLRARWREGVAAAMFQAWSTKSKTLFWAQSERSEGRIAIIRFAYRFATGPKRLTVDDALTFARVRPPAPFDGVGTFRAAPDGSRSWEGTLSVDFPGAPATPLTGTPFRAALNASL